MALMADKREYNRRITICSECPWLNKTLMQCKQCMCFLKVKARLDNQVCPIGKWHKKEGK
jgi:hypothetical protein